MLRLGAVLLDADDLVVRGGDFPVELAPPFVVFLDRAAQVVDVGLQPV